MVKKQMDWKLKRILESYATLESIAASQEIRFSMEDLEQPIYGFLSGPRMGLAISFINDYLADHFGFERNKYATMKHLLQLSPIDLLSINSVGKNTVINIIKKIKSYHQEKDKYAEKNKDIFTVVDEFLEEH